MRVHPATMADADVVMSILDVAARRHGRMPWSRPRVEQGIEEEETLLGYVETAPVATATLQRSDAAIWGSDALTAPAALYLHRLASSMPGRGFGAAMLAASEQRAMAVGARLLRLDCSTDGERLRRYYRELGYVEVREVVPSPWRLVLLQKRLEGQFQSRQAASTPSPP
jgi:ribosomal protein S18 acetylase RimI-like enzyme